MRNLLSIILLFCTNLIFSQIEVDTTLKKGWNPKTIIGLNISQISFKDWSQGGSNSLSYSGFSRSDIVYVSDSWRWANSLKLAYGRTKLESQGYRTTDNELFFESVLSKSLGWKIDPYFSSSVRSSITKGFDYKTTPEVQTADFFDPGYVTQAIGFLYQEKDIFTTRLGVSFQETFANKFAALYSDDDKTADKVEKFKLETGLESVTSLVYEFLPNTTYLSSLRFFTRFDKLDVWDVRWDNYITAKVNDYLNVNLNVLIVHEINQTRRTQIKQTLNLGFVFKLI
jgi:hypothetical protein